MVATLVLSLATVHATEPNDPAAATGNDRERLALEAEKLASEAGKVASDVGKLAAGAYCACSCGNHLPGSHHAPTCFGCSVGKADLAFIRESLATGRPRREILLELTDPILVEVFADYDDARLPALWERAQRVATELHHRRVVLRTPARTGHAQRAVALAECARLDGFFTSMQRSLIHHDGPWDQDSLLRLAERESNRSEAKRSTEALRSCLASVNVKPQIDKDRDHAKQRGIGDVPAIFVNQKRVDNSEPALRRAIQEALRAGSV